MGWERILSDECFAEQASETGGLHRDEFCRAVSILQQTSPRKYEPRSSELVDRASGDRSDLALSISTGLGFARVSGRKHGLWS